MIRFVLFSSIIVSMLAQSVGLADTRKMRNPMKRRSLEENLRLLAKMKKRFPVIESKGVRARMNMPQKKEVVPDSANPLPTVAYTPVPTIAPTMTPLPTAIPTSTPMPTIQPTNTPMPTATALPSYTATPVPTPKVKPTRKPKTKKRPKKLKIKRKVVPKVVPTPKLVPTQDTRAAAIKLRALLKKENVEITQNTKYALAIKLAEAITWPEDYLQEQEHINLCALNPDVEPKIVTLLEKVELHSKNLKFFAGPANLKECHVVLIDKTDRLEEVLRLSQVPHILTVGIGYSYRQSGVLLAIFKEDDGTVGLSVDKQGVEKAGLSLSQQLMELAQDIY